MYDLVVDKMKGEACGVPLKDFIETKSKMCTFITKDNHKSKKAKSMNKNFVDDELKY